MRTLHIYHNRHLRSVINNFNENDVIIIHNKVTIDLINHLFKINNIELINLTYITIKELLEGKIDNMKFNYIVGNPPYEYPSSLEISANKKLYIDITKKVLPLLSDDGVISFVTPKSIFVDGQQNSVYNTLLKIVNVVNYNANDDFNIGQSVCSWTASHTITPKVKIIDKNKTKFVNKNSIAPLKFQKYLQISNKVNYKINKRNKMNIICSNKRGGVENKDLATNGKYKIHTHKSGVEFEYTNVTNKYNYKHLLLPYAGNFKPGFITNKGYSGQFYLNKNEEDDKTLQNMKQFIDSKLITYCIYISKEFKGSQAYTFYTLLPEVDLSKEWTNEELYNEFNISDEEIKEIEEWNKEWNKEWENK